MSAWIGPLGSLIEFKCPSAVESTSDDPHVYFRPLGGAVAVTRLGDPTRPRVWNVSVDVARPDHVVSLQGLGEGEWGPGPFTFIPPAAHTLNLLGKRAALAMGAPGAGYVNDRPGAAIPTSEGVAGTGYKASGPSSPAFSVGAAPVTPGRPVTGKAWAVSASSGPASLQLVFHNAGGAALGSSATATAGELSGEFLHATMTAPATAAYVSLMVSGATITRPQVTWTDGPRTWSPSAASTNVVLSPLSNTVRRATGMAGEEQLTDHAFTVTELIA